VITALLLSNFYPLLLARPLRLSLLQAAGMSVLLSAPLSMIVVAGTLGREMGIIDSDTAGALILTALLASVLYPSLFRLLGRRLAPEKKVEPGERGKTA
jgi:Kef-type K+ transport system membrane component KefB